MKSEKYHHIDEKLKYGDNVKNGIRLPANIMFSKNIAVDNNEKLNITGELYFILLKKLMKFGFDYLPKISFILLNHKKEFKIRMITIFFHSEKFL